MRFKIIILTAIFSMIYLANAPAQERSYGGGPALDITTGGKNYGGVVSLTGQLVKLNGNGAKFNEYRDLRDGVYGRADFGYDTEKYYLDFSAYDIGYKTQHYELTGGKWGDFKYYLAYDQIPHNFTFGARSFYNGIGGNNLTLPAFPANTDVSTWKSFDYSVERTNYGGGFNFDMLRPFHFSVSASKEERRGVYPIGTAGTSPGGIAIELPDPINYMTDTIKLEAGYIKNPLSIALNYSYTQFKNDNSNLNFVNPATANTAATTDTFTLPPNNSYYKLDLKGAVKLPLRSKFNFDLASSSTQSGVSLFPSYVANVTAATSNIGVLGRTGILSSSLFFNGKVDTQNYNFMLTSNPFTFLDAKVFYKYYDTTNRSDQITTTDSTASPTTFSNDHRLFDYSRERYGLELGFRLPFSLYLTPAYTHVTTKRKREDIPKNEDDIYGIELRWSRLDFLVAKVGYERLQRSAEVEAHPVPAVDLEPFIRRFDGGTMDQDTYKAIVDFFPIENLTLSVGYRYKKADYKDTILGLRKAERNEFNVDVDYLVAKRVRLFGYFDFEYAKLDQFQRQLPSPTTAFNPALLPTTTAFNWTVTETDRSYAYGLGTDIYIIPNKMTLRLQHTYVKAQGFADYTYLLGTNALPAGRTQDNIDISNMDNYQLTYFLARTTYNITKSLSLAAGYAYEKYVYDDAQYNGYNYTIGGNFLTGAYNNPSYEANIVFLSGAYRF